MPPSIQQQAKGMAKQWWDTQASQIPQSTNRKSLGETQDFIDSRSAQTQQQQKSDYYQQYDRQLNDMNLWAQNSQSIKTNEDNINRQFQGNQNAQVMQRQDNQYTQQNASRYGGKNSETFGRGAAQPNGYAQHLDGSRGLYDMSSVANWNLRNSSSIDSTRRASEAEAAGDVLRAKAQGDAQERAAKVAADADAARQANQNNYAAQEAAKDREAQQKLATLQGYSISPGSFQYWGGRV